uniref:Ig-like domain-containing protein n=1 Tax=Kryptolebias marmoratus TaxID=37003 RepID=A0A3Q3GQ64_KRYMA
QKPLGGHPGGPEGSGTWDPGGLGTTDPGGLRAADPGDKEPELGTQTFSGAAWWEASLFTTLCDAPLVKWRNSKDWIVHIYQKGLIEPDEQHELYRDRTEMKTIFKFGDLSLTLAEPTERDTDTYTCTVYNKRAGGDGCGK